MRVLAYQLGSLGDTVVTIPALRAARRHFGSDAELYILHDLSQSPRVSPKDVLLGERVDGFIGYRADASWFRKLWTFVSLWSELRKLRFEAVVYLLPSERTVLQVKRDKLFFALCGIPVRVGFHAFSRSALYPFEDTGQPATVRHEALCRLGRLERDGFDISAEKDLSRPFLSLPSSEVEDAKKWLAVGRRYPDVPLVAICPGSKQPANSWPAERFIEIGRLLLAERLFELIVIGGRAEEAVGERLIQVWGGGLNAAGRFSVLGSACLLKSCKFVIGLDTGTTHLAAALGVPCLAIYGGREHPGRWDPLGDRHIVIRHSVACSGCGHRVCPEEGHPCMREIEVDDVWESVRSLAFDEKVAGGHRNTSLWV